MMWESAQESQDNNKKSGEKHTQGGKKWKEIIKLHRTQTITFSLFLYFAAFRRFESERREIF